MKSSTSLKIVQHELFPDDTGISRELLLEMLTQEGGPPVKLTVTTNRVTMASVDFSSSRFIKVRVHELFLKAPGSVIQAFKRYLKTRDKSDWAAVAEYARSLVSGKPRRARRINLQTAGTVFDLAELKADVSAAFFSRSVSCRIEWGRPGVVGKPRGRRSMRFGSWDGENRTIRINPALDDRRVPYEFLRYIVFHEMLHAVVPEVRRDGRRYWHSPAFTHLEKSFPNLAEMRSLAKELVRVLE